MKIHGEETAQCMEHRRGHDDVAKHEASISDEYREDLEAITGKS